MEEDNLQSEAWARQLPARIRPLARPRTKPRQSWLTLPLAGTWALQLSYLMPLFIREVALFSNNRDHSRALHGIGILACGSIVWIEIGLWCFRRIRLASVLVTQICKAVAWTTVLLAFLIARDDHAVAALFIGLGMLSTFTMLAYTIFRHRREAAIRRAQRQHQLDGQEMEQSAPAPALLGPLEVNQASSLKHGSPIILQMVNWIQLKAIRARETTGIFHSAVAWASVAVRYCAVSILASPLLFCAARLPNEPQGRARIRFTLGSIIYWLNVFLSKGALSQYDPNAESENMTGPRSVEKYEPAILPRNPLPLNQRANSEHRRALSRSASPRHPSTPGDIGSTSSTALSSGSHGLTPIPRLVKSGPTRLCILSEDKSSYSVHDIEQLHAQRGDDGTPSYVFVSYTRRHFNTTIPQDPSTDVAEIVMRKHEIEQDKATLTKYAIKAAQRVGVPAFWIDFECVRPEEGEAADDCMQDVYRICDVVRLAHSLAIVVGPSRDSLELQNPRNSSKDYLKAAWLRQWSDRLWTLPEALLSPSQYDIAIFYSFIDELAVVPKRNFASRAYHGEDAESMARLLDHHERSLTLSALEYNSLAFECLQRRQTNKRMQGDVAYALMGLQSQRPLVVKEDSAFQAFARLSLANDTNRLLERMLCLSPKEASAQWYDLSDEWDARLWHISPLCYVAELDGEESVLLGDTVGAVINWSHLEPVDVETESTTQKARWGVLVCFALLSLWWALVVLCILAFAYFLLVLACILPASQPQNVLQATSGGAPLLSSSPSPSLPFPSSASSFLPPPSSSLLLASSSSIPLLSSSSLPLSSSSSLPLRSSSSLPPFPSSSSSPSSLFHSSSFSSLPPASSSSLPLPSTSPSPPPQDPESDSSSSSNWGLFFPILTLLSCLCSLCVPALLMHLQQKGDFTSSQPRFYGIEGTPNPDLIEVEQRLFGSRYGTCQFIEAEIIPKPGQRKFTLIDSYNGGLAIEFWASQPPQVVLVVGRDRGWLRALLCSYDWETKTLERQATVRLETTALDRMHSMEKVRFSVR